MKIKFDIPNSELDRQRGSFPKMDISLFSPPHLQIIRMASTQFPGMFHVVEWPVYFHSFPSICWTFLQSTSLSLPNPE